MIIGIGSDILDIRRIERTIERHGDRFLERIFTTAERAKAEKRTERIRAATYAKRFAAKEAVLKVLGVGLAAVPLTDVEVLGGGDGPPTLQLHGRAAERAEALGVQRWHLSLTHTDALAQATALAET
jgi:holo-[acyl-carrier protein] synthase